MKWLLTSVWLRLLYFDLLILWFHLKQQQWIGQLFCFLFLDRIIKFLTVKSQRKKIFVAYSVKKKKLPYLDTIKMQIVALNFFHSFHCPNILGIALEAHMNCNLEMVLFLTHKCFVWYRIVKTFIRIHSVLWGWPVKIMNKLKYMCYKRTFIL